MLRLIGISYSMWTEQARWALDHHIIRYRYYEHIPLVTTPLLRLLTKKWTGPISVPILITPQRAFTDSWDIVAFADREGHREKLIPFALADEIRAWHDRAEIARRANRVIATDAISRSEDAKRDSLPDFLPEFSRNVLTPLADLAIAYLGMKYEFRHAIVAEEKKKVRALLREVRQTLADKKYLLGQFSYADITVAATLEFVRPVEDRFIPLKPALRAALTQEDLSAEFADLLEWRDQLYQEKRSTVQSF
ncbi:MAG: glutathione S-transferase [Turneriella sp.]|nr:glutathione S-transferase [Turneriella sp.]